MEKNINIRLALPLAINDKLEEFCERYREKHLVRPSKQEGAIALLRWALEWGGAFEALERDASEGGL